MKSSTALVVAGFLVLVASLGLWVINRPSPRAGDAGALERALTSASTIVAQSVSSTTTSAAPVPGEIGPAVSAPQFTISRQSEVRSRVPVGLRIPDIDVQAPIRPSGVETNGDMEVPQSVSDVGWYKFGPAPGEPGSAVLAAHVDLASQGRGVFFDLRNLEPGATILVDFDDGTTATYRAEARTIYDKTDLPIEAIFAREGPPVLTLITCGGGFNRSLESYDSNVVVYAVPIPDTQQTDQENQS